MPMRNPDGRAMIQGKMDVVHALLGMDILDRESVVADTVSNRLTKHVHRPDSKGSSILFDE